MSPVPLSVAPSRETDAGIVGLSEVTHPDDNRIEVADGSQKRRPSIRTSAGGWRPVTDPRRSLLVRTDFPTTRNGNNSPTKRNGRARTASSADSMDSATDGVADRILPLIIAIARATSGRSDSLAGLRLCVVMHVGSSGGSRA